MSKNASIKKKVGILGGSFDPVHFGHLNLAICLMESCGLDEVLFVPTSLSPFKENAPPKASPEHRLAMLKLAIDPIKKFRILDWEIHNKGPAYTIDTVRRLPQDELHLLIGEDHLSSFDRWKEVDELIQLAPPLIGARETVSGHSSLPPELEKKLRSKRIKIPLLDISSTNVRERLTQKKYCGHLVPALVLNYIQQNHLYL
jgi:nicotinate-nucleotide adenylyltransferase